MAEKILANEGSSANVFYRQSFVLYGIEIVIMARRLSWLVVVAFRNLLTVKNSKLNTRYNHALFSTVKKPIAMMFMKAITSMFTKTSVFAYYNITTKQNNVLIKVNYNKFLYTVKSNLQDSIYSVCTMSQL